MGHTGIVEDQDERVVNGVRMTDCRGDSHNDEGNTKQNGARSCDVSHDARCWENYKVVLKWSLILNRIQIHFS